MLFSRGCKFMVFSIIAACMAGCSEEPQTVEWYMQHKAEREVKLKWCGNDMSRAEDPDCFNASKAEDRIMLNATRYTLDTFKILPKSD